MSLSILLTLALGQPLTPPAGQEARPVRPGGNPVKTTSLRLRALCPVLVVAEIEPCLAFWAGRLGFRPVHQLPGRDGRLQFLSLEKDGIELMYQTRASVLEERPDAAPELVGHSTALYVTVEDLDAVARALGDAPVVKARHRTSYGSEELYVREPGGNTVGFALFRP